MCGAPGHEVASTGALRLHADVEPMQMPAWIPDEESVMHRCIWSLSVEVEAATAVAVAADIEEAAIGDAVLGVLDVAAVNVFLWRATCCMVWR